MYKQKKARQRSTLAGGSPQLPLTQKSLTAVFGMGTGVTSSLLLPDYAGRPIIGALLCPLRLVTPSRIKIRSFVPILVSSNHLMLVVHLEKDSLKTKSCPQEEELTE